MWLSNLAALIRSFNKTAPVRYSSGRGLLDELEHTNTMTSDQARGVLETILQYYKTKQGHITITDLVPVLEITGKNRSWLHHEISMRLDEGSLWHDETRNCYEIML